MTTEHSHATPPLIADMIEQTLAAAITERGAALIAVSGGRSPIPIFHALRGRRLPWDRVTVALVDERWVAPDHPDSNERLVRDELLADCAAAARFVPMKNAAVDATSGQPACEAAYRALPRPFDIMLLGMGEDGHTASLFPGAPQLCEGLETDALTIAVTPPAAAHQRLSLTLSAILASRRIVLPISGAAKRATYQTARNPGPVKAMPIRAVLRQSGTPVEVWIGE
ncbi:6-phosphogluconolactonase [Sphingomonas flavalba]|uniref:6-phosphogluconolactonase n=1 Tax=Sphingomonas flavalba TaxID=2559804 RepID=UPI00109DA580|nr:6-phosphogluconolactonase [Sphingomonas flavalba]